MWYSGFFETALPTDDFETIKNGITVVVRLLQQFPCIKKYSVAKCLFLFEKNYYTAEPMTKKNCKIEAFSSYIHPFQNC